MRQLKPFSPAWSADKRSAGKQAARLPAVDALEALVAFAREESARYEHSEEGQLRAAAFALVGRALGFLHLSVIARRRKPKDHDLDSCRRSFETRRTNCGKGVSEIA
jgi:hypothetical protein